MKRKIYLPPVDILLPHTVYAVGDRAFCLDFGPLLNDEVHGCILQIFRLLQQQPLPGVVDMVPAYTSFTIYVANDIMEEDLPRWHQQLLRWLKMPDLPAAQAQRLLRVPVCYDPRLAPDLEKMAAEKRLGIDELATLHAGKIYEVYLMGFLPGFAYMASVPEPLRMPRKDKPVPVAAGAVAIAGQQTGIYPLDSPGGWQVIGRTPVSLFDPDQEKPCFFQPGDRVQFYPIRIDEFDRYTGRTAG